jgi:hypothetical protein
MQGDSCMTTEVDMRMRDTVLYGFKKTNSLREIRRPGRMTTFIIIWAYRGKSVGDIISSNGRLGDGLY